MALELKGLKANMLRLQATVGDLNTLASDANEKGNALKSHLGDIKGQIGTHVDDIEFAANILGNSSGESEKLAKGSAEEIAAWNAECEKLPPAPVVESPEVKPIAGDGRTFQRIG